MTKCNNFVCMHISGIANNAASFFGVETILNNKESSNIYFSANVSILLNCSLSARQLYVELDTDKYL